MTPQQLKNSILQLAIEGKLVEQNAEDGNSREFLEELLKDAEEFNKNNGKSDCNKFLNINEYDMPFSLPSNWCWVRLGDICSIARGGSPRPIKDYITNDPNGINWIKIGDTNKDDKYINKAAEKIKLAGIKKSRFVYPGDFLLTNSMSFGRPYILNIEGCIHDGWLVISQYEKLFDKNFLFWVLSSRFAYEQFCKKVSGAVVKNLNIDKVAKSIFPVPPIREQIRIVERIEKIFLSVDLYAEKWEKLEALNQKFPSNLQKSILQEAIQGKLCKQIRGDGDANELIKQINEEKNKLIKTRQIKKEMSFPVVLDKERPFVIPDSWCWTRLKDLVYNRGQKKPETKFSYIDIGSIDNINQKLTNLKKYTDLEKIPSRARRIVGLGDILYSTVRPYLHNMCIVDKVDSYETIASTGFAVMTCYKGVYNKYLFYYLLSPTFDKYTNSAENSKGVAYPSINDKQLYKAVVPLPPLNEQKRIVKKIEDFFALADRYKSLMKDDYL